MWYTNVDHDLKWHDFTIFRSEHNKHINKPCIGYVQPQNWNQHYDLTNLLKRKWNISKDSENTSVNITQNRLKRSACRT